MSKIFLIFFVFVFIIANIYSVENFEDNYKINLNDLEIINLNNKNPIICRNSYCVNKVDNHYRLYDTRTSLNHSKYDIFSYRNVFTYARHIIDNLPKNIKKVCIIGFGLGGLPLELAQIPTIEKIDCVDIDINMYIMFKNLIKNPSNKINYYLADGGEFMENINETYDLIIDDAFGVNKILFDYTIISHKLNSRGILYINCYSVKDYENYEPLLKSLFMSVSYEYAKYNVLIKCIKT